MESDIGKQGEYERDAQTGRFVAGNQGGYRGGRRRSEFAFQDIIDQVVTPEKWVAIVRAIVRAAVHGDVKAASFLSEHRWGKPKQRLEHVGDSGGPIIVERRTPSQRGDDGG